MQALSMNQERSRRYIGPICVAAALGLISASAWGEAAVSLADLEGTVVEVRSKHSRVVRREGRDIPNQVQRDWRITFMSDGKFHSTTTPTVYGKGGVRKGKTTAGIYTLEQAKFVKPRGGGHALWLFEDGTLTHLRTFQGGGTKRTIAFAHAIDGLSCRATESIVREDGVTGVIAADGDGRQLQILASKQISSNCRITKQGQAPIP
jgi:hypothetical protein